MPDLGRFFNVDPLSEDYAHNSTYAFSENRLLDGIELEGLEFFGLNGPAAQIDAAQNPNGLGAHAIGLVNGAENGVSSAWKFITSDAWKAETWKAAGNLLLGSALAGQPGASQVVDAELGTNSTEAVEALETSVTQTADKLVNGNGIERGEVLGESLVGVVGAKGTTALTTGVKTAITLNKSNKVFRVFGGDAKADGFSWTPVDPKKVDNFRDKAGLPSGGIESQGKINTAESIVTGTVKNKHIMNKRAARPLDGNKGGLPEYIIDPKNVKNRTVSDFNKKQK